MPSPRGELQVSGATSFGGLSPGAGRSIDLTWPAQLGTAPINGTNIGVNVPSMGRQAMGAPSQSNTTGQGLTGVASSAKWGTGAGYRGRQACAFVPGTGGASTGVLQTIDPMVILPSFGPAAGNQGDDSATDDWACWRCFALIALESQTDYTGDTGIFWSCANVGGWGIRDQGASGWGFSQTAVDTVSFVRRSVNAGGVLTVTPVRVTSAGDLNLWHSYEIRVIGARKSANAQLKAYIDGAQVLQLDWVNDALPNPLHQNLIYGYVTNLQARGAGAGAGGMGVNRVRFMAGPTEASLL